MKGHLCIWTSEGFCASSPPFREEMLVFITTGRLFFSLKDRELLLACQTTALILFENTAQQLNSRRRCYFLSPTSFSSQQKLLEDKKASLYRLTCRCGWWLGVTQSEQAFVSRSCDEVGGAGRRRCSWRTQPPSLWSWNKMCRVQRATSGLQFLHWPLWADSSSQAATFYPKLLSKYHRFQNH